MKELSIEEKAKAYNEALKLARDYHEDKNCFEYLKGVLEHIFPELAESEDERIRKEIQRVIEQLDKDTTICGKKYDYNKWLSCLEKQGNPADKIEPKFKNGQWIVFNGLTLYIKEVVKGFYRTITIDGIPNSYDWDIDNIARLWTIQDAKDGDVLAWDDSKCIALFKNIYDKDSFNSHGFVGHCSGAFESRLSYHDIKGAHPATKEQHDLLFQKMKEADYEWTAADNGKVQEIINALEFIGKEKMISYNEEIKWLQKLKYRFDKDEVK